MYHLNQPLGKQYSYGKGPIQAVYTSHEYQQAVKEKGVIMSMPYKGTPADNASLKCETFYLERILRTTNEVVI